tara:strand:+ start:737 stop:889 length:153 start_codon:yes stop_codon:yes gene_type:complete
MMPWHGQPNLRELYRLKIESLGCIAIDKQRITDFHPGASKEIWNPKTARL